LGELRIVYARAAECSRMMMCDCKGHGDGFFPQIVVVKREGNIFPRRLKGQW